MCTWLLYSFKQSAIYNFLNGEHCKEKSKEEQYMESGFVFFSHYVPYFDKKIDYFIVIGLSNCGMGGPFPKPTTLASC